MMKIIATNISIRYIDITTKNIGRKKMILISTLRNVGKHSYPWVHEQHSVSYGGGGTAAPHLWS